jgi:hypothetical protein
VLALSDHQYQFVHLRTSARVMSAATLAAQRTRALQRERVMQMNKGQQHATTGKRIKLRADGSAGA